MNFKKNLKLVMIFSIMLMFDVADAQVSKSNFEVDQFLIRVQLREGGSIEKSLTIKNTGSSDIHVNVIVENLESVVLSDKASITLRSGSSDTVNLKVNGVRKDVFVGKLVLSSAQETKEIPIVVEIESETVVADLSINPLIASEAYPGSVLSVDFSLLNLVSVDPISVRINYEIRGFNNNTLLEENELVVVKSRASLTRTFNIANGTKAAPYVLTAKANYKESLGTTTFIFYVENKEAPGFFEGICKNNAVCRAIPLLIFIFLSLLMITLKSAFRKKAISPRKMEKIASEKANIQKKLDYLVDAYKSKFITRGSYKASRKKLNKMINTLNKKG